MAVTTKSGLKEAVKAKENIIEVEGGLAKSLHFGRKAKRIGGGALVIGGLALIAAPFTGGASVFGFGLVAPAAGGTSTVAIIGAVSLGLGLLLAIYKGYEEIDFSPGPVPRLTLKRKRSGDSAS